MALNQETGTVNKIIDDKIKVLLENGKLITAYERAAGSHCKSGYDVGDKITVEWDEIQKKYFSTPIDRFNLFFLAPPIAKLPIEHESYWRE